MATRLAEPTLSLLLLGAAGLVDSSISWAHTEGLATPLPPQPLPDALESFSRETGVQVLYGSEIATGVQSRGAPAGRSNKETLRELLRETGLAVEFVNRRTVTLVALPGGEQEAAATELRYPSGLHSEGQHRVARDLPPAGAGPASGVKDTDTQTGKPEEVVVTGTHIRGIENATAPMIVIERSDIERSGYSNTQDIFRNLPQNFSGGDAGASEDGIFGPGANANVNVTGASGINLRGLGTSSTLVLLNGHRIAPSAFGSIVDVSLIPISAIERVEVVTDGSSAVYGSDAVGGVVNIITRKHYRGADSALRYGTVTDGDREESLVAHTLGGDWSNGGLVGTLQYQEQNALRSDDRAFSEELTRPNDLLPRTSSYAAALNGRQMLTNRLDVYADGLFSRRDVERSTSSESVGGHVTKSDARAEGLSLAAGFRNQFASDWLLELGALYGRQNSSLLSRRVSGNFGDQSTTDDATFESSSIDLILTGRLLSIPSGAVKIAVGSSYRDEDFEDKLTPFIGQSTAPRTARNVRALFGEIRAPLVKDGSRVPLVAALDLSMAVRYDDYSDFGSTSNPRVGINWALTRAVAIRAAYGKSFRAPNSLEVLGQTQSTLLTFPFSDPSGAGAIPAFVRVGSKSLGPERARTFDMGVEYRAHLLDGVTIGINYYGIRYEDRIITPPFDSNVLTQPDVYGQLIAHIVDDAEADQFLNDALAQGVEYFDLVGTGPTGVRHVIDLRQQNAAIVRQSGLDVAVELTKEIGAQLFTGRVNASFIDKIDTAFAAGAAATDLIDTFGNPTSWRVRVDAGWSSAGWSLNGVINFVDSYVNTSGVGQPPISSWTTFDFVGKLDADRYFQAAGWRGVSVMLSVHNAFDKEPPFVDAPSIVRVNYDAANASPLGRFIAANLRKRW